MLVNVRNLKQPSNAIFFQVAGVYAVMIATIYGVGTINPSDAPLFLTASVLAWAIIGWGQFALFNALHEGLHRRFGSPHREFLCFGLAAYPLGFDETYRQIHLDHHKYFGDAQRDPDYFNYGAFPTSKRAFIGRFLLNLCGWNAMLQFFGLQQAGGGVSADSKKAPVVKRPLLKLLAAQLLVLSLFSVTVGWLYYFWLWLLPLATFGKLFTSTRAFCEHASPDNEPTIRTITGGYLGEKILGVFCFHYHAEHHLYVGIPYNQLEEAHVLLRGSIFTAEYEQPPRYEMYSQGYFQLIYKWFRDLPL